MTLNIQTEAIALMLTSTKFRIETYSDLDALMSDTSMASFYNGAIIALEKVGLYNYLKNSDPETVEYQPLPITMYPDSTAYTNGFIDALMFMGAGEAFDEDEMYYVVYPNPKATN